MFQNKTVIVTGAAQGIGRSIATHFAKAGANVVIADILEELGQQLVEELSTEGFSAIFINTDIRKEENVIQTIKQTIVHFGKIDILVNNAGKGKWISPLELHKVLIR